MEAEAARAARRRVAEHKEWYEVEVMKASAELSARAYAKVGLYSEWYRCLG